MNTKTQKNIQLVLASAATLVILGMGLNIAVMQTLGSFDAASVMLALFLAFWAFVLGSIALILSSIWWVMRRQSILPESVHTQPEAVGHAPVGLQAVSQPQRCMS